MIERITREDKNWILNHRKFVPKNLQLECTKKDSIFNMHIPKSGGTYLRNFMNSLPDLEFYSPTHLKCNANIDLYPDPTDSIPRPGFYQDQLGFDKSLRISCVRNPFQWLTSYYFHSSADPIGPSKVLGVGGIRSIYPSFDSFVDAYCNEDLFWPRGLSWFRKFYPFQIFNDQGKCQAHFILKNGNKDELNMSLLILCMSMGYLPTKFPNKTAALMQNKENRSVDKKKDYREYYSAMQVDALNKKWNEILEVFGYNFHGSTDSRLILDSSKLEYCFAENKLRGNCA